MKKVGFLVVFMSCVCDCFAQKHDYVWLLGYSSNPNDLTFGGTVIDFNFSPYDIYYEYREMNFDVANTSACDTAGNLLLELLYYDIQLVRQKFHKPAQIPATRL